MMPSAASPGARNSSARNRVRCQVCWMMIRPSPNTPANSAPDTHATPPITSASTMGNPPSIVNCDWLIVS